MDGTDKYAIVRKIADGGMAEIFLARFEGRRGFQKQVVLKRIRSALIADPQFRNMLIDEAHIAMGLNHGNIAQVLELGESNGRYFLALELVDGWSLSEVIKRARSVDLPLPVELALYVVVEVCRALSYAHNQTVKGQPMGIVHRDVSPQNVLVSDQGEVKLTDFGIAKAKTKTEQTSIGVVKGKIAYMSPEQASGGELDHRSDLFSLGICLYSMATGKMPFEGGAPMEVMVRIQAGDFTPPDKVNKKIGKELSQVIQKAMALKPGDRFQTADAMLLAAERVLRNEYPPTGRTELKAFLQELHERDGIPPISRAASPTAETELSKDPVEIGSSMQLTTPSPRRSGERPRPSAERPRPSAERPRPSRRRGGTRRTVLALVGGVGLVLVGFVLLSTEKHPPAPAETPPPAPPPPVAKAEPPPAPAPATPVATPPAPPPEAQAEAPATPAPEVTPEPATAAPATETTPDAGLAAEADEDEDHLLAETVPDAKDVVIGEEDGAPEEAPPAPTPPAPPPALPAQNAPPPPRPEPVKVAVANPPPKKPAPPPKPDPKADTVSVLITSQPAGAVVKLKSRVFGKTPIPLRFRTGITFELTFVKNGYTPTAKRFLVTKKKDQKVVAYLHPHRRP